MSTALQKRVERQFLLWLKDKNQGKVTLWQAYLRGYSDGVELARKIALPASQDGPSQDSSTSPGV